MAMDSPWPVHEVIAKLCEAADILLDDKSYDGHGHELIAGARRAGRDYLETLTARHPESQQD